MKKLISCILIAASINGSLLLARTMEERTFIHAARKGRIETIDRLFSCMTVDAYDKALLAAARKGHLTIYRKIAPSASIKGRARACASLRRHCRKTCCNVHVFC